MINVIFKSILIVDTDKHKAKYVSFLPGLNVITSSENHVGKSSLAKSLYFSLGAEIDYDPHWDKKTKLYCLEFLVNDKPYSIVRQKNNFLIFNGTDLIAECTSVFKELAPKLEEIFGFSVYLPDKNTKKHVLAPPVFTYLPYYIDQDHGWGTEPYESFASLDQFKKPDRIKSLYYHLGVYNKHSVDIQAKIDANKAEIERLQGVIDRAKITLETILPEVQQLVPAQNVEELEQMLLPSKERINRIIGELSEARTRIQKLQSDLLQHKKNLNSVTAHVNYADMQEEKALTTCPKCGYEFGIELNARVRKIYNIENSEYLLQQIRFIIDSIEKSLTGEQERYVELMSQLSKEEQTTSQAHDEYETYVKQRGLTTTISRMHQTIGGATASQDAYKSENRELNKDLRNLPNKKEVDQRYIDDTRANIMRLEAWDNDYEGKIGLLKPLKGQGTLSSKIILAQYIALFSTMEATGAGSIRFPFVVDSPRTKEPSVASSVEILNMISGIKTLPQIILVTMDYSTFDVEKRDQANIIELKDPRQLLNEVDYDVYASAITGYLDILASIKTGKEKL
ncbi:hypothetical protein [Caproiciproducens galactitolivorans]|uniref:Chromosome partition protein Smc n=1 Tax=Caproiciproducens galactitolivorans TaxID=642589 RepID=A0ABT4BSY7_9FIRM|nr:hypothetical protein [Caproiciproducens galactitolivorans]MCY1714016.1 hypothetical protein [Caproiciproducens galactitolivorans]